MPRYYIDVRGHFGTKEDLCGIDLPDLVAAHDEALRVAGNLLESWAGMLPYFYNDIVIEIMGEDLRPVLAIPYSEIARQVPPIEHDIG